MKIAYKNAFVNFACRVAVIWPLIQYKDHLSLCKDFHCKDEIVSPLSNPDSKVHGTNMGSTWGWQDPGGPHVGPMNFAIWESLWWEFLCQ